MAEDAHVIALGGHYYPTMLKKYDPDTDTYTETPAEWPETVKARLLDLVTVINMGIEDMLGGRVDQFQLKVVVYMSTNNEAVVHDILKHALADSGLSRHVTLRVRTLNYGYPLYSVAYRDPPGSRLDWSDWKLVEGMDEPELSPDDVFSDRDQAIYRHRIKYATALVKQAEDTILALEEKVREEEEGQGLLMKWISCYYDIADVKDLQPPAKRRCTE